MKKPLKKTKKIKAKIEKNPKAQIKTKESSFGLTPLSDRVIVKEIKSEEGKKTDSGIYIPDTVKEDRGSKRGRVVAVGEGRFEDGKLITMKVKKGDEIMFSWGDTFTYKGEEYTIIKEAEVIAIIK